MERKLDLTSLRSYLTFPFRDRDATNRFLIGAALYIAGSIIPIVPLIPALGYQYRVMSRVVEGEHPGMPEWADWGRLFIDGLKMLLIGGVYVLPGIIVFFGGMFLYFFSIFGMSMSGNHPSGGMLMAFFISMILMFLGYGVGMLLILAGWLPLPFATTHAIAKDDVIAAFRVGQWWRIMKPVRSDYVIAWIVIFGLGAILYTVYMLLYMTIVLCLVLPLVLGAMAFYIFLVASALFAAIYRQGAVELGESISPIAPVAPPAGSARPGVAPHVEPASGEMIGVETASKPAPAKETIPLPSAAPKADETTGSTPAAGEMIALDVANETAGEAPVQELPAAAESVVEAFAPELPADASEDSDATVRLGEAALLAGSLPDEPGLTETPSSASDPNVTRRLPLDDQSAAGPAESFGAPFDPGATRRLPNQMDDSENAPNQS